MRPIELSEVGKLALFRGVAPAHLEEAMQAAFLQRFPAHVEMVTEGEPADFLHFVIEGQVEVYSRWRDRETTIAVLGPGASFIVAAVLTDRIYLKSARTLSTSRILMVPAEAVRRLFSQDSAFAGAITGELALAYRDVVRELKNQKLRTSLERLACWLVVRNRETGGHGRFDIPFDKKILASRIGMAPEVLSRSFGKLVAYGVTVTGPSVTLSDLKSLENLAKPTITIDEPNL